LPATLRSNPNDESFVAIDFGTRATRVALARGANLVRVGELLGEQEIPAALALAADGGMLAGSEAFQQQALFPRETVLAPKLLLTSDPAELGGRGDFFPHEIDADAPQLLRLQIGGRLRSAIELAGLYLSHVRRTAEIGLERPVESAVLTVPVAFTPFDRQALRLAARLAGFRRVRMIDETTAVALAWIGSGFRGRLGVCSWGAGYFGVSLVEASPELVRVVAATGDARLGGEQIERALASDFLARAEEALRGTGAKGFEHRTHVARHLLGLAPGALQELGAKGKTQLRLHLPGEKTPFRHVYERAALDAWLAPALERAEEMIAALYGDLGLLRGDVDGVLLAGGMTRIPQVRAALGQAFGREPSDAVDPGEAALRGALHRARFLDRSDEEAPLTLDALPLTLGLEGQGGIVTPLLRRTEMLPASVVELFTTYLEKQTEVGVQLFGHRGLGWEKLARIELAKIPGMKEGEPQLEIRFAFDEDGALQVSGQETSRGRPLGLDVRPERGLTAKQLAAAEKELPGEPEDGFQDRLRDELGVRARVQLTTLREVMRKLPGIMTRDEKQLIAAKSQELVEVLEGGDTLEMQTCSKELSEAAHPVLLRVYDKSLEALLR